MAGYCGACDGSGVIHIDGQNELCAYCDNEPIRGLI